MSIVNVKVLLNCRSPSVIYELNLPRFIYNQL
jgi:hypothetical protein